MRSVVLALTIMGVVKAASDFHGGPQNASPYFYSEINSMEYDTETDYQAQFDTDERTEGSSQLVSSLSFDGGCFVSAQAIMCNGGAGDPLLSMDAWESEEDLSEDEDNDDDDDGHSSMLSNASVRRSKALASGPPTGTTRSLKPARQTTSETEAAFCEGEIRLKQKAETTFAGFPAIWGFRR